ncbi:hypothetical protein LMG667_19750 [Xanthomonas euvesicatoria]|uniref:hypothetical protein n=1 Tax=Xanthomonas euvesicatoria TaxID=456327 RepID=UPI00080EB93B|nr:hypothetical protein [Xanthomonas euvesicatoria]OCG82131.1 hypothetical protein LMG667_19750 [Xanthomonas euvesicatoria]
MKRQRKIFDTPLIILGVALIVSTGLLGLESYFSFKEKKSLRSSPPRTSYVPSPGNMLQISPRLGQCIQHGLKKNGVDYKNIDRIVLTAKVNASLVEGSFLPPVKPHWTTSAYFERSKTGALNSRQYDFHQGYAEDAAKLLGTEIRIDQSRIEVWLPQVLLTDPPDFDAMCYRMTNVAGPALSDARWTAPASADTATTATGDS